ncbi:MAG: MiaB/RimO family radical SAM methylthiotransferase [Deltaproteobacteria bacterium]|jgi:threonylcarbamoyladenosine tRNA methylthiotransferase MtaB|nr:MiaB/RimO family radical SAM methylthiotransferase [Deltaproteobacteria bacterium]
MTASPKARPPLKAAVVTFGCKVNQFESSAIIEELLKEGYTLSKPDEAGLLVVNACAVTEKAAAEARRLIRKYRRLNPALTIVATGCLAQLEPEALSGPLMANLVVGQLNKSDLVSLVAGNEKIEGVFAKCPKPEIQSLGAPSSGRTRAFLKIQDGCSAGCAYCAVPLARGRSRSLEPDSVLSSLSAYLAKGAKEVVLTGIHLGHWGLDLSPPANLKDLINLIGVRLKGFLGDCLLRLSSIEPLEIALVEDKLAEKSWLAPHLHAPLQSGSDKVLSAMGRPYKAIEAEEIFVRLKEKVPDLNLGTDVMCGFPGETDADFQATASLIDKLPFGRLHAFPFSPRRGTRADKLPGQIPSSEKSRRMAVLKELAQKKAKDFLLSQAGKKRKALVLSSDSGAGRWRALTDNYIRALLPQGFEAKPGQFIEIVILAPSAGSDQAEAVPAAQAEGAHSTPAAAVQIAQAQGAQAIRVAQANRIEATQAEGDPIAQAEPNPPDEPSAFSQAFDTSRDPS